MYSGMNKKGNAFSVEVNVFGRIRLHLSTSVGQGNAGTYRRGPPLIHVDRAGQRAGWLASGARGAHGQLAGGSAPSSPSRRRPTEAERRARRRRPSGRLTAQRVTSRPSQREGPDASAASVGDPTHHVAPELAVGPRVGAANGNPALTGILVSSQSVSHDAA